jgi:hypothetical protein
LYFPQTDTGKQTERLAEDPAGYAGYVSGPSVLYTSEPDLFLPTDQITSEEGKSIYLSNTNKMLHEESEYFNKEVAGVKTGTTNKAGNCLVSVFSIQNERYLCIVMNSSYYGKFTDTQTLYEMCAEAS